MFQSKQCFVYIMTNKSGTLYTGITNNLVRRVYQHKTKLVEGFTKKYRIDHLVHYETFTSAHSAIASKIKPKRLVEKKENRTDK
jgi:putative endonuclease